MILRELTDQVKIENIAGDQINPATNEKLDELKTLLNSIFSSIDGLEGNTDELETKIQSVRNQLDVLLSTRSSESTAQMILNAIGEGSGTNLLIALQNLLSNTSNLAQETTLIQIKDYLDTVETKLQTIITTLDINLSTRASEATVSEIRDAIGQESGSSVVGKLGELNNKDFSTEVTLNSVLSQLDITLSALRNAIKGTNNKDLSTLEIDIESILNKLDVDLSTRASDNTLQSILNTIGELSGSSVLVELQNILNKLNIELSSRASEETLIDIKTNLDDVKLKLDTLNLKDFSTETTLMSVLNAIGETSGFTLLSVLQSISNKDFATQTTLALIKIAIDNINSNFNVNLSTRASEVTLGLIKIAIDAINTDIDVALSTRASENTLVQIRDYLDTVEIKLQSIITQLDVTLSTRASEVTLSALNTKFGEVQASPSNYTVLARLKDIWDKLVSLFNDGVARVKLWNGTYQVDIDSTNHILVAGKNAVGQVPSSNPITISGVDSDGFKRYLLTDTDGKLFIGNPASVAILNIPLQLGVEKIFTTINNGEWQEVLSYTVPSGYDLNCIGFDAYSNVANEKAKAIFKEHLGSYNTGTNTFVDGNSLNLPRFDARMYIYVTSAIGAGANDIITVTYTNQDGITGRTGTVTVPKNSLVGTRLEVPLQGDDIGFTNVTNVTHTQTGQAGVFNIEGNLSLFYLVLTSSNVLYNSPSIATGSIVIPEGGKIYLQYKANSIVSNERRLNLTATLVPR